MFSWGVIWPWLQRAAKSGVSHGNPSQPHARSTPWRLRPNKVYSPAGLKEATGEEGPVWHFWYTQSLQLQPVHKVGHRPFLTELLGLKPCLCIAIPHLPLHRPHSTDTKLPASSTVHDMANEQNNIIIIQPPLFHVISTPPNTSIILSWLNNPLASSCRASWYLYHLPAASCPSSCLLRWLVSTYVYVLSS